MALCLDKSPRKVLEGVCLWLVLVLGIWTGSVGRKEDGLWRRLRLRPGCKKSMFVSIHKARGLMMEGEPRDGRESVWDDDGGSII